jgi:hypothetical protein
MFLRNLSKNYINIIYINDDDDDDDDDKGNKIKFGKIKNAAL